MDARLTPTPHTLADVDIRSRETLGQGWGRLERFTLRHRRFDGTWSEVIQRDLYTIAEVGMVLPYDPKLDAVVLIEQFRTCGLFWGEATWLFEAVAGIVDPGETPPEVARREAMEEAGCTIDAPIPIATVYSSPGGYGERTYMFAARTDLSAIGGTHGLAEEHEDIRAVVVPLVEAYLACLDGRVREAKTILMIQWLMLNKSKLT
ncbi:MAG: NUDIX domain-containing protein [Parvibaculum sp.]|uniref:NUDIX domain-containing protein n=1 Tax=Parvibaculum sp. TaxID=2024848 RepID=UPI00284004E4|nr:NUDIX domain-containing protein [Parvibaculum sp.]MDR3498733.1 NUDIX domain-containing protein [Parvibaculum sp.]